MTGNSLILNFKKHISLTDRESEIILSKFRFEHFKRKTFFLREGAIAHDVAFVLSGCLRSYSVDENGFEHILQFAPTEWWITDMHCFISEQKAHLNIDVLADSEVALLSRKDQIDLFEKVPKLERYFRIITENALVSSRQRNIDFVSLTAKQRYKDFCRVYPALINEIPLKLIAQYIGITPEFLSKIRSEF